ncbi:aldo/keto reductase [Microlunatus sp. Gsoil 973]|uniref:aldo/keto reductase n=1 Tax=Microlunatus sp. Gsoil 973 TaxID=2672569 RepID=UPI0012B472ED|nr:aldo/keto reductase [Microlunatus sp. Gsoil 973]QGN35092.1 aldo/keto reductase [Microlunatus sp. Gsoil 973]
METRILHSGSTDLEVTALCMGIMNLGVRQDEATSFAVLDRFWEGGGRFFDTANNYGDWTPELGSVAGDSERVLGRWIASRRVADEVVVATKCGAGKISPDRPLSGTPPTNYEGLAPEVVRRELTKSLANLGVDRVGVYYGHVDDRNLDITEIADLFSSLVDEGLIQIPGMSNTATWRLAVAREHSRRHGRAEFGAWQQQHSIYWPKPGEAENTLVTSEAIDYVAAQPGLTITTYSPQQGGQLARPWMPVRDPYDHPDSLRRLQLAHRIAHDHGGTVNQVVMAWHLSNPRSNVVYRDGSSTAALSDLPDRRARMLPIFGASSVEQVDEALGTLDLKLTDEELAELDAA